MRWMLLFALACALPLHAEDFLKCRGEGGATAYRGKGCLPGETLVAILEPVADPPLAAQRRVAVESSSRSRTTQKPKRSRTSTRYSKPRSKRSRKNPCKSAKKARDDFQRRRGIHVTMDELSRWNHRVYDACK